MKTLLTTALLLTLSSSAAFAEVDTDNEMNQYYQPDQMAQAIVVTSQPSVGSAASSSIFGNNSSDDHSQLFPGSPSAD